ncbi:MAG: branched-chain amino acid aminotransferase [Eubacteriaceae bacterium]|jgi:branched-chain amino acid aminotransferase|nr:branched-chain amino acid aminotransferase [Eubacteriaceae bacterium]
MSKKNLDWSNIPFDYVVTDKRFESHWKEGAWDAGGLTDDPTMHLNECAQVLQYSQCCFEGLKAYETKEGNIVIFRPDLNAQRMYDSEKRLEIPPYDKDQFVDAVKTVVRANADWVPPYGSGASLYIRPFVIGSGIMIGVAPAPEFTFRIFSTPVGPYFKGGVRPISVMVADSDRAAPRGTGDIKAGLNYAMSLSTVMAAHRAGFDDCIYLDPATQTTIEEASGANIIFIDKDGGLVVPKSNSILPSVTRRSLVDMAKDTLGMKVTERVVRYDEIKDFAECGLCGTAAVIAPVYKITKGSDEIIYGSSSEITPVLAKMRKTLTDMQVGDIPAPEGWVVPVE